MPPGPFIPIMPRPPETFSTERLFARKPRREDAEAIFNAYASDPVATRYLTFPTHTSIEPVADFLQARAEDWDCEDGSKFNYMLCMGGTNTPIGALDVGIQDYKAMFGYALGRAHWGKGYMTEALRYLVDWALAQPEIFRAWAFCDAENPASARVMEKAGMTREGILRHWHIAPNISPEPRDCIICAKVR